MPIMLAQCPITRRLSFSILISLNIIYFPLVAFFDLGVESGHRQNLPVERNLSAILMVNNHALYLTALMLGKLTIHPLKL